jgi:hypothetical protein
MVKGQNIKSVEEVNKIFIGNKLNSFLFGLKLNIRKIVEGL